jgi:hypothetical protein
VVNKFPKTSEGVYHSETTSTDISKGLEKRGFYKNSEFPRGSSGKPFLKGSKIRNLVNRGVWILNGMAPRKAPLLIKSKSALRCMTPSPPPKFKLLVATFVQIQIKIYLNISWPIKIILHHANYNIRR